VPRQAFVAVPKNSEGPIIKLRPDVDLDNSASGPSYFTQIKKEEGKLRGYRLNGSRLTSENTWRINLDQGQVIKDFATQYTSISAATKHNNVLPTVYGGEEGDLFYKFLDSNMFSVITANKKDPSTLTIYLINGVTGRIVH